MAKITDQQIREFIKNVNHGTDNLVKCFIRNDEFHKSILEEMSDQKQEMIMLRTQTNNLIKFISENNTKIMIAMIGLVSASIAVVAFIIKG